MSGVADPVTKFCKYCSTEQPINSFQICGIVNGKVYRRLKCQQCKQIYNNKRRAALRSWLVAYKKTLACVRCGFSDFRALEFHHREREDKIINVADAVRSVSSLETVKREIAKCVVLCSNCHRIEHYEEQYGAVDRA